MIPKCHICLHSAQKKNAHTHIINISDQHIVNPAIVATQFFSQNQLPKQLTAYEQSTCCLCASKILTTVSLHSGNTKYWEGGAAHPLPLSSLTRNNVLQPKFTQSGDKFSTAGFFIQEYLASNFIFESENITEVQTSVTSELDHRSVYKTTCLFIKQHEHVFCSDHFKGLSIDSEGK